jgi:hypothetical protein
MPFLYGSGDQVAVERLRGAGDADQQRGRTSASLRRPDVLRASSAAPPTLTIRRSADLE